MNTLKTAFLLTLLTLIAIGIGQYFGGRDGMLIAFFIAVGINFFSYFFSDKLALAMNGARPVTREQLPRVYQVVERLTQRIGLPMPKIYVIPTDSPTLLLRDAIPSTLRWQSRKAFCGCSTMKSWKAFWPMNWGTCAIATS